MFGSAKTCCSPDGHCKKTGVPAAAKGSVDCKQIAFEDQKLIEAPVVLSAVIAGWHELFVPQAHTGAVMSVTRGSGPSPPNLQILHSTFLV